MRIIHFQLMIAHKSTGVLKTPLNSFWQLKYPWNDFLVTLQWVIKICKLILCVLQPLHLVSFLFGSLLKCIKIIKCLRYFGYYQDPILINKWVKWHIFLQAKSLLHPMTQGKDLPWASTPWVLIFTSKLDPCVTYQKESFNIQLIWLL